MVEMILGATPEPQPSFSMVLDNANTAVVVSEISQPNVAIQLRAAGTLAPSTPNVARVSTMGGRVAAFARDGNDADQQERDDHANNGHGGGLPERNAETERPRAVRHGEHGNIGSEPGQNRLAGVPLRSSSDMVSIPCSSMERVPFSLLM